MAGIERDILGSFRQQKDQQASQMRIRRLLQNSTDYLNPMQIQELEQMLEPLPEEQSFLEPLFTLKGTAKVMIAEMDGNRGGSDTWRLQQKMKKYFKKDASSLGDLREYDFMEDYYSHLYDDDEDDAQSEDEYYIVRLHDEEAELMAKLITQPSRGLEQLHKRQHLIEAFAVSEHLDELLAVKNQTYNARAGISNLLSHYSTDPKELESSRDSLINIYHRGITEVPETINKLGYEWSAKTTGNTLSVPSLVQKNIEQIHEGLKAIQHYEQLIKAMPGESIQLAFADLPDVSEAIQQIVTAMAVDQPLGKDASDEQKWGLEMRWKNINEFTWERIEPALLRIGALTEFADLVRREEWAKVTFDPSLPEGYKNGWSLEKQKDYQVHNDSPADTPITVFSGANTSGKSYAMQADFMIHLTAQALGYAPVQSGNFRLYNAFAYLDRASTDPDNNLSAFMREVKNWNETLPHITEKTRLYVDEGYSTTSPQDQARLLLATADDIQRNGGSVVLATHNEKLLDHAEKNPHASIYHFGVAVDEEGDFIRSFKLTSGADDSHGLDVARARNFPKNALESAERYIANNHTLSQSSKSQIFPEMTSLPPDERDRQKRQARSLEALFPMQPDRPLLRLYSTDPDFEPENFLRKQLANEEKIALATEGVFDFKTLVAKMILYAPPLAPAEILERQKIFAELMQDELFSTLSQHVDHLYEAEPSVELIRSYTEDGTGINQALNPFSQFTQTRLKDRWGDKRDPLVNDFDIQAAIVFLEINHKLLAEHFPLTTLLKKFQTLKSLWKKNPDNQEVLAKDAEALFVQLENANGQLPSLSLQKIPLGEIQNELSTLQHYNEYSREVEQSINVNRVERSIHGAHLLKVSGVAIGGLPRALLQLPTYQTEIAQLFVTLQKTDSVHLHQTANYLNDFFTDMMHSLSEIPEEKENVPEIATNITGSQESLSRLGRSKKSWRDLYSFFGGELQESGPFTNELERLHALCLFSAMSAQNEYAPVQLNTTGRFQIDEGFSLFKTKDAQIANPVSLGGEDPRIQILTGPNGSGKTFYEKAAIAAALTGLATGYAPAKEASIPPFDTVIYYDRVTEGHDRNLSSFATEIAYLNEVLPQLDDRNAVFACIDEIFSTTSPGYQAPLTFAVINEFARNSHHVIFSTHNHEVIDALAQSRGATALSHFKYDVADGELTYRYQLDSGHEPSRAIEVARTMGLKREIVDAAEKIK